MGLYVALLQYPLVYRGATAIPGSVHWCYCNILQCTVVLLQYPLVYRGATAISSSVLQYPLQYPPVPAGSVLQYQEFSRRTLIMIAAEHLALSKESYVT
jgi:hypothetical protein